MQPLSTTGARPDQRHPVHDRIAALARPGVGDVVVDLGCGPGGTLAALAAAGSGSRLVGLDLYAGRLQAAGRLAHAVLVRSDLSRPLPIATASVDVVVCHNVIELLPEPADLLAEVRRVVRPRGRVVLSHTDFAGLTVHGGHQVLTDRILHAYAHVRQPWMKHIDAYAARRLPALAVRAGLVIEKVDGHVLASFDVEKGCQRLAEVAEVVRGHVRRGEVDLTGEDVDAWWQQLVDANARGEFLFAEMALITVAGRP